MSDDASDRQRIIELLGLERSRFSTKYEAVPPAARAARPAAGGWSAAEVVQHVSRVEAGVVKMIGAGPTRPRGTEAEVAAAQLTPTKIAIVRDRSVKVEAPERVHPAASPDAAAVLVELEQSRAALLAAFQNAEAAMLDGVIFPHPFIGPLTLRAWVELVAHHDARHAEQLAER